MNMRRLLTPVSISAIVVAFLLTYYTYPPNGYITLANLKWMAGPLTIIELPSMLFGILVSGNIHQPDPVATFIVLFLTYLLLVGAVGWLVIVMLKRIRATKRVGLR